MIRLNLTYAPEQQPPRHEHAWIDYGMGDMVDIVLQLCGQHCACGAIREYRGPAFGWKVMEPAEAKKRGRL